jgi:serine/threonine protein kinase
LFQLENILVNKTPSGGFSVTLADFGLAKQVGILQNKKPLYHSPCGTPGYMAPEIMCQDAYHKAADIFAIGVSLYTM